MYCDTCRYLEKGNECKELRKQLYINYECLDNSDFYIVGFDVEFPKSFGCTLHTTKETENNKN